MSDDVEPGGSPGPASRDRRERAGPAKAGRAGRAPRPQAARAPRTPGAASRRTAASPAPAAGQPAGAGQTGGRQADRWPAGRFPAAAVDRRLASLHLRLGSVQLARAELEAEAGGGTLDAAGLADLAEARWRAGDLEGGAEAANAHLAAEGDRAIARLVAAEAAAAAGRPGAARAAADMLGSVPADAVDALFAGMPRRALWPSPGESAEPIGAFGSGAPSAAPPGSRAVPAGPVARDGVLRDVGARDVGAAREGHGGDAGRRAGTSRGSGPGLWPAEAGMIADEPAPPVPPASVPRATPDDLLARARDELRTGEPDRILLGTERLALALRLDPGVAPRVLELVARRTEAGALMVRGDACRVLGRSLEAEAAYDAAAAALAGTSRRAGG